MVPAASLGTHLQDAASADAAKIPLGGPGKRPAFTAG